MIHHSGCTGGAGKFQLEHYGCSEYCMLGWLEASPTVTACAAVMAAAVAATQISTDR